MANVSPAKPGAGGAIWMAPAGTTLPTDATTALADAFKSLGYVSEDGMTRSTQLDSTPVRAWGGDVVAMLNNGKTETFRFRLIEPDNLDALGLTYGEATGTLSSGITVKSKADLTTPRAFVFSMLLVNGIHKRLVIPNGVVTAVGDTPYKDSDVVGAEVTITAIADANGVTCYDYEKLVVPSP